MKKLKTLMLSGSTLLLLAACGAEETQQQPTPSETTEPVEQMEETDQTDQTQETADTGTEETGTDNTTDPSTTEEDTGPGIENREFEYSLDDTILMFFDTYPEAEGIDKVEFDVDDGRYEYEIDGFNVGTEFELTVDAETGEILEQNSESDDDTETPINFDAIMTPQEAMQIALEDAGTGYVKEWELERDDGRTEYDIDIEGAEDRDIDAETGEVVDR